MNREEIIRMARDAGFTDHNGFCEVIVRHSNGSWIGVKDELERFAALVAATEREACAKVCEAYTDNDGGKFIDHEGHGYECAAAIRARSKQ